MQLSEINWNKYNSTSNLFKYNKNLPIPSKEIAERNNGKDSS